jgi:hypothetical protein
MPICAHPWCWGSVGLRGRVPPRAGVTAPTKTSLLVSQVFGSLFRGPALSDRTGPQVDITRLVYVCSRLIRVVVILSSISLVLMVRNHLAWISFSVWGLSCITLSHLSTHMRCIDSAIRICSRRAAPLRALCLRAWCSPWVAFRSPGCGTWMEPHPSAIPKLGVGQSSGELGNLLAWALGRHYYTTTERHNDRQNKILRARPHLRPLVICSAYDRSGLNTVVRPQVLTSGL